MHGARPAVRCWRKDRTLSEPRKKREKEMVRAGSTDIPMNLLSVFRTCNAAHKFHGRACVRLIRCIHACVRALGCCAQHGHDDINTLFFSWRVRYFSLLSVHELRVASLGARVLHAERLASGNWLVPKSFSTSNNCYQQTICE